jgi:hypothetical protein
MYYVYVERPDWREDWNEKGTDTMDTCIMWCMCERLWLRGGSAELLDW